MPAFQRRHYETLASVIATMHDESPDVFETSTINTFTEALIRKFTRDNPRFNAERFRVACTRGVPR